MFNQYHSLFVGTRSGAKTGAPFHRPAGFLGSSGAFLLLLLLPGLSAIAQTYPGKVGMGLGGLGGVQLEFPDVARTLRPFEKFSGGAASTDANGWPTEDARTVFMDHRPFGAWWKAINNCPLCQEDVDAYQIDVSGTYKLSFKGKADLRNAGDEGDFTVANQRYDVATNTTTADVIQAPGRALMIMDFYNTDGGVKDVRLIRPGYHNRPTQTFRDEFLNALRPYPVLRFMDWTVTNNSNPPYPGVTTWEQRSQMSEYPLRRAPWELILELANLTGKDIWINLPISADDAYVRQLASLFRNGLKRKDTKIYLENSNEVWNGGFDQYGYNVAAARAEVQAELNGGPASALNDEAGQCDPNDNNLWGGRRHIRRGKEIGDIFVEAFSPGSRSSFGTQIRPVFAWQIGGWVPYYSCILEWFEKTYGPGSARNTFYGVGAAAYVNDHGIAATATVDQILEKMKANSDAGLGEIRTPAPWAWWTGGGKRGLKQIADIYGLKLTQYETGPDNAAGWEATNAANRIRANRAVGMKDVVLRDLRDNWFNDAQVQGDLIMYFVLGSSFSRWGSWGATEDISNLHSPKLKAIYDLIGVNEDLTSPVAPGNVVAKSTATTATVTWTPSSADVTFYRVFDQTGPLATIYPGESLAYTVRGLRSSASYTLRVVAYDGFNNASPAGRVTVATKAANLQLATKCTANPGLTRGWRVKSTFDAPTPFRWVLAGTDQSGTGTVPAGGEVFFETGTVPGSNVVTVTYETNRTDRKESNAETCDAAARLAGEAALENGRNGLLVYPNPATDRVTVTLPAGASRLLVTNLQGRQLKQVNGLNGRSTVELNVAGIPGGMYLLHVIADGKRQIRKLKIN